MDMGQPVTSRNSLADQAVAPGLGYDLENKVFKPISKGLPTWVLKSVARAGQVYTLQGYAHDYA